MKKVFHPLALILALALAVSAQVRPAVPTWKRLEAVKTLLSKLKEHGKKDADCLKAADFTGGIGISEPIFADSKSDLSRVIAAPKVKRKFYVAVMPVFESDKKMSATLQELIDSDPAVCGVDEDAPVLYFRADRLDRKDAIEQIAAGSLALKSKIESGAYDPDKVKVYRKTSGGG